MENIDDRPMWRLDQARELFWDLVPFCQSRRLSVSLHGSLLVDTAGRDLDLILLPLGRVTDPIAVLDDIADQFGWTVLRPNDRSDALHTVLFEDRHHRLVDITLLLTASRRA